MNNSFLLPFTAWAEIRFHNFLLKKIKPCWKEIVTCSLLVFWPYSVFGQNHLCVMMRQTWIPFFRVKSEEFQSSLSAIWTPICLLFHPSGRRVILSGHQTDKHHLSGRRASSVRTPTSYREASEPASSIRTFQQHVWTSICSRTVH